MLYQAIITRFKGPTDFRGARIVARAEAGTVTVSWDHALDASQNHARAAEAYARKYEWTGAWVGGGMPDETGYAFVRLPTGMGFADAGNRLGFTCP